MAEKLVQKIIGRFIRHHFMAPTGWADAASCPQEIFWFCINESRNFVHHLDQNLCIRRYGDVFT